MKKFINILLIILPLLLWLLQNIPTFDSGFFKWIDNHLFWISLIIIGAYICSYIGLKICNYLDKENCILRFFDRITEEHLIVNDPTTRITLFKKESGMIFFWRYLLYVIKDTFTLLFNPIDSVKAYSHIPSPFCDYLVVSVRKSYPRSKSSYTYFKLSSNKTKQWNGVVDKCFHDGLIISLKTVSLENISLAKTFKSK